MCYKNTQRSQKELWDDIMTTTVHIILPVFRPNEDYLEQQIKSLKRQHYSKIIVYFVIADCDSDELVFELVNRHEIDYKILATERNLDSVRAFQFGLSHLLKQSIPTSDYIALCDQDDIWHPDKLTRNIEALERTKCDLVHSDARVIDKNNETLQPSLHDQENRVRSSDARGLLYLNNITGMTAVFTARMLKLAVPFPRQAGTFFHHDLWLGLIASALGGVHFINEPLVDYRQHDHNVIGALTRQKMGPKFGSLEWRKAKFMEFYLANYLAKATYMKVAQSTDQSIHDAANQNSGMRKLRPHLSNFSIGPEFLIDSLKYYIDGKPVQAKQAASFFLLKLARLAYCTFQSLRTGSFNIYRQMDALDRYGYSKSPGAQLDGRPSPTQPRNTAAENWESYLDPQRKLRFLPNFYNGTEPSLNVLVPTLNPNEIFAGIQTAIDFGCELASKGHNVRFISTDIAIGSITSTKTFVANAIRNDMDRNTMHRIDIQCGVSTKFLDQNKNDMFFATAWWTAHAAHETIHSNNFKEKLFFYLVQDYEPNFYPWGSDYAGAIESYSFEVYPIFNTNILYDFFRNRGISFGNKEPITFGPSIDLDQYFKIKREPQAVKRIALYGRPEVARNLFETCVVATKQFVEAQNLAPNDVEIFSMGMIHEDIELVNGLKITSVGKLPFEDYMSFLGTVDIGIALMLSPHPSHLPLEMAAAGVDVVTNHFENKNLSELSEMITSCEPTSVGVAEALGVIWNKHTQQGPSASREVALSKLGDPLSVSVERISELLKKHNL